MTEFLHEIVKKRERNNLIDNLIQEIVESDPWRYSEPPPPFTGNRESQAMQLGQGPY